VFVSTLVQQLLQLPIDFVRKYKLKLYLIIDLNNTSMNVLIISLKVKYHYSSCFSFSCSFCFASCLAAFAIYNLNDLETPLITVLSAPYLASKSRTT